MIVIAFEYGWTEVGSQDWNGSRKKKRAVKRMLKLFIICFLFSLIVAQIVRPPASAAAVRGRPVEPQTMRGAPR